MDLRKLKTLIDLVSESNIAELEITEADGKVRIVKATAATVPAMVAASAPAAATAGLPSPRQQRHRLWPPGMW
jgi:acetyl-CoA carboxylase biotin carboxyl carrier protein